MLMVSIKEGRGVKMTTDILQHHGVKGMKWGVKKARNAVSTTSKSALKKINKIRENSNAKIDAYHNANKNKRYYKLSYNTYKTHARGNTQQKHRTAVRAARMDTRMSKALLTSAAASAAMTNKTVRDNVYKVARKATSPEAVRMGKNIMQAVKRSPIRYVDGKQMKNVVNTASNFIR